MRAQRTWTLASIAAAAVMLPGIPATQAPAAADVDCASSEARSSQLTGFSADAHPVVLVHGWNGAAGNMEPVASALQGLPVSTFRFDYHDHRGEWAAEPAVSGCLAQYVGAVSAGHLSVGGDGKVILVGHSMGGLAARFAADRDYADDPIDDIVAGVVTIDTPHLGSPFGDEDLAEAAGAVLGGRPDDLLFTPEPGSDASVCLAVHSPPENSLPDGCAIPPYLPAGTPLAEIAGSVDIRRTLFGIRLYTVPLGSDGIVPVESSHGYVNSGPGGRAPRRPAGSLPIELPTIDCRIDFDQVIGIATAQGLLQGGPRGAVAGIANLLSPGLFADSEALEDLQHGRFGPELIAFLVAANAVAPCSHTGMLTEPRSLAAVRDAVARDIEALEEAEGQFAVLTGPTAGFGGFRESNGFGTATSALIDAFGPPDATEPTESYSCDLTWEDIGAVVTLGLFGSDTRDPCEDGIFLQATLTDPRWQTEEGIGPGSSAAAAQAIAARDCTGDDFPYGCSAETGYVLGLHRTDCGTEPVPNVIAETDGVESIRSLIVFWHGCE